MAYQDELSLDEELDQILNPNGPFFFPFNQEEEEEEEEEEELSIEYEVVEQFIIYNDHVLGLGPYSNSLYDAGG